MRVVIAGASGRMGTALARCAQERPGVTVVGAVDRSDSAALGRDFGELSGLPALGVPVVAAVDSVLGAADLLIDFSSPDVTARHLRACAASRVAVLIGTTGLGADVEPAALAAADRVPVLIASNTSLGVTLLEALVRAAAKALPADFDIEIVETHHRHKKDAPSGTALTLGRAAAEGRGCRLEDVIVPARAGVGARQAGEIGFAVLRGGDVVGDHSVLFVGEAERLTLSHQATDRAIFARGALRAGEWLTAQRPGRYAMSDVIGIKSIT